METLNFSRLLLKTAFSCMACDGDIDQRELVLIKKIHKEKNTFGDIDLSAELNSLISEINQDGNGFLRDYLKELKTNELSENDELTLIELAIETIKADDRIDYNEIKFFKVIRSKLKISNEIILEKHPDFEEYLEQDIMSRSYLSKLQDDFLVPNDFPKFEITVN